MITIKRIAPVVAVVLFAVACVVQTDGAEKDSTTTSNQALTSCVVDTDCPHHFRCADDVCFDNCGQGHFSSICQEGYAAVCISAGCGQEYDECQPE